MSSFKSVNRSSLSRKKNDIVFHQNIFAKLCNTLNNKSSKYAICDIDSRRFLVHQRMKRNNEKENDQRKKCKIKSEKLEDLLCGVAVYFKL